MWQLQHGSQSGTFRLIGRLCANDLKELRKCLRDFAAEAPMLVDLAQLHMVDGAVVRFLARLESQGVRLENCPSYIREWITRERGAATSENATYRSSEF